MRVFAVVLLVVSVACGGADDDPAEPGPDAATGAELLPYMATCAANEECDSGLCFEFNAKGPHCTTTCELDLECEAPSPGCNGKGVCKAPDGDGDGGGDGSGGGGGM